jgi:hypothetical protein
MTEEFGCNNENNIENKKIVASVSKCVTPDCRGWLTDVFAGKYWVRCLDPKHDNNHRQLETEEAATQSIFLNQPEQCRQQKKRIIDK